MTRDMVSVCLVAQSHDISVSGSMEKFLNCVFACIEERRVLNNCGHGDWKEQLAGNAFHRHGGRYCNR